VLTLSFSSRLPNASLLANLPLFRLNKITDLCLQQISRALVRAWRPKNLRTAKKAVPGSTLACAPAKITRSGPPLASSLTQQTSVSELLQSWETT
jgi:hypothetical protein